jgi:hypothetical protein
MDSKGSCPVRLWLVPLARPDDKMRAMVERLREYAIAAGRDPAAYRHAAASARSAWHWLTVTAPKPEGLGFKGLPPQSTNILLYLDTTRKAHDKGGLYALHPAS